MAAAGQSLAEFAKSKQDRRVGKWMDTLPESVQQQVLDANGVGSRVIVEWLQSIGYEEATYAKVDGWRREHRRPG